MRVKIGGLLWALQGEIAKAVPGAEHYAGRLEEGFLAPAFFYSPIYQAEQRANVSTSKRTIEIQLIYFGKTDGYGREDQAERLRVQDAMEGFLSQGCLAVGDRWLQFAYEMKDVDERLACYLTFRFYDEAVPLRAAEEAAMEPAEILGLEIHVTGV